MNSGKVILALNGELQGSKREYRDLLDSENVDKMIAADGGALFLRQIGYYPEIIIGDLDSLSETSIENYKNMGVEILRYPVEKDETDAELVLNYCHEKELEDIIILGSLGGRFDQQLANIFLLEYAINLGLKAVIKEPGLEIGIINKEKIFTAKKNSGLSLLPLSERVYDIFVKGCKYSLDGEELIRYKTRGISNIIKSERAVVSLNRGTLLYVLNMNI